MRTRVATLFLATLFLFPLSANAERFESDEHTFGSDVQADGLHVVVGAPGASVDGDEDRGRAHVYLRGDAGWVADGVIAASDGAAQDRFGDVVAIDGGTIAVGAPYASVNGLIEAGAVYVFERSGTGSWSEVAKITAADPTTMARFGRDLDLDNGQLAIAAPRADEELGRISGAVYIFERDASAGSWQQTAKLERVAMDQFPREVAISGDRVAVGTAGYVLTYRKGDSGWEFFGAVNSDGAQKEIELEGDVLAVAEPQAHLPDIPGPSPGRVQVFEIRNGAWNHVASLESPLPTALDYFGFAMDLRDGIVAVANGYEYNPHVSLFIKDGGGAWARAHELDGGLPRYEKSLAISAQALVTGVPEPFDSHIVIYDTADLLSTESPDDDDGNTDDDAGDGDDSGSGDDAGSDDDANGNDNSDGSGDAGNGNNETGSDIDDSGANSGDTGSGNDESGSGDAGGDSTGASNETGSNTESPAQDSGGGAPGLLFFTVLAVLGRCPGFRGRAPARRAP